MSDEVNFVERYDSLLNIKPSYGYERQLPDIKFNYVGFEIEIAVEYERSKYSFIRTLLKQIKKVVGDNGYFTKDGTILGEYSFEIVLDPMSVKKVASIYDKIMKIVKFSDGIICFDKEHNCGLHMNFNQYDIEDINISHKRLLILMNQKRQYIEENIYKKLYFELDFEAYLKFQKNISSKYLGINYLNKRLVEVRNIKTGLSTKAITSVMYDIINALFPDKLPEVKDIKHTRKIMSILSDTFQNDNKELIKESLNNDILIIKFGKKGPKIIKVTDKIKKDLMEVDIK
ncbi:MAG: hypothetical protein RR228_00265 [Bacilli bacterium]